MAFGIKRKELKDWKDKVSKGDVAIITHFWLDPRFPYTKTVTKIGCSNIQKLQQWGKQYQLRPEWIHQRDDYPHFDVFGERQINILQNEGCEDQLHRFNLY